jgi:penicillin-binding protein-related factor A (putative recombinase)
MNKEDGKINTNLASEFYVLSMLYRKGANAVMTVGNKKAVDIVVYRNGKALTIDVKGLRKKMGFPVGNCTERSASHYLACVCFMGSIEDEHSLPEVYIVPSKDLDELVSVYPNSGRKNIEYGALTKRGAKYKENWKVFL